MNKLEELKKFIGSYNSALVAFSGGVDSTFLAKVASMVLGDNLLLVTATSITYPDSELESAENLAADLNIRHQVIESEEISIPQFSDNTPDRCYYCKHELFSRINKIAKKKGLSVVFEGSIVDDLSDYRPGSRAIKELSVVSPLLEVGLEKEEIRSFSRTLQLETAEKPSFACLASRFPYGDKITTEKLLRVGSAEEALRQCGLRQFRVRSHDNLARIEVAPEQLEYAWTIREKLAALCKKSGFTYTALDCTGYRTGAMNESLPL